ncbi:MAG: preprotein translocase subunit SecE [Acidobacteria bacterium]|nr:preprotein translocase subunit SecE [Acidobacteriota bacterium]
MSEVTDVTTQDPTPEGKLGQVKQFYTDVNSELKKVTWPTRDEVYGTTVVVIIAVFFFGAFLWVSDHIIGLVFKFLTDLLK